MSDSVGSEVAVLDRLSRFLWHVEAQTSTSSSNILRYVQRMAHVASVSDVTVLHYALVLAEGHEHNSLRSSEVMAPREMTQAALSGRWRAASTIKPAMLLTDASSDDGRVDRACGIMLIMTRNTLND